MTLAALSATLSAYQDTERAEREIPVLAMLATPRETLRAAAEELRQALLRRGVEAEVTAEESPVGGGSVPTQLLPTWAVAVLPGGRMSVNALEEALRRRERPIVGRISAEQYLLDVRTIDPADFVYIAEAAAEVLP
jgi:L-seryl-tRNA(Ser) seleniumtransferase